MASTKELQRSLPKFCLDNENYHKVNTMHAKYAVYALTPLNKTQLQQFEQDLNSAELSNGNCRLAPRPDFSGCSLRDIYDYHLRIRQEDRNIHPYFFILADQLDWNENGVLFVDLARNDDVEHNRIGVGRCGVDRADCYGANLEISNLDWMDLKEREEEQWGGDDPYATDSQNDTADQRRIVEAPKGHKPGETWRFGWYSLVELDFLEPDWLDLQPSRRRFQMLGDFEPLPEPWKEIRMMHPCSCLDRPEVHRQLVAVIEKEDANSEDGVAIVRLEWDGNIETLDEESSQTVMPPVTVVKKVPAAEALAALDSMAGKP